MEFYRNVVQSNKNLEKVYSTPRNLKCASKHIAVHKVSWGVKHNKWVVLTQNSLWQTAELQFHREEHLKCVFIDASETFGAGIVTQMLENQLDKIPE